MTIKPLSLHDVMSTSSDVMSSSYDVMLINVLPVYRFSFSLLLLYIS